MALTLAQERRMVAKVRRSTTCSLRIAPRFDLLMILPPVPQVDGSRRIFYHKERKKHKRQRDRARRREPLGRATGRGMTGPLIGVGLVLSYIIRPLSSRVQRIPVCPRKDNGCAGGVCARLRLG